MEEEEKDEIRGEEDRQMSRDVWFDSQGISRRAQNEISRVADI